VSPEPARRPTVSATSSMGRLVLGVGALVLIALGVALALARDRVEATSNTASALMWMLTADERLTVEHQRVTYEDGEDVPYHQESREDRLSSTSEVARTGSHAGTVLLLPDDPPYRGDLGYRAEWQSDVLAEAGGEYSYGASYYLPVDWNQGRNSRTFDDRIIFQFHEGNGKSPTFSLHINADTGRFFVRHRRPNGDFDALWSTALKTETWYDFAFRVHWTKSGDGFFQVYLNGRLAYQYEGRTLNDSNRVYTKWGIYGQPTKLVVDDVSIVEGADGLFEVTPARLSTLMTAIPKSGVALVRFSGGQNADLVASSGCPDTAMFWTTQGGELVWFNPIAPDFVNARWDRLFEDGLPRNTLLIATCGGGTDPG